VIAMDNLVYSVNEVSKVLSIGLNKTYELINNNKIPSFRVGNKILIPKITLDEWLQRSVIKD
jgi:excisionase family DNA binding protein